MRRQRENPFAALGSAFARRTEDLALEACRLDARLSSSGLGDGWQNRCDINEAVMAIQMDGALVDLTDLVLHDANMNTRAPTHELTRAAAALRARRLSRQRPAPWPLSHEGVASLGGGIASKRQPDELAQPVVTKAKDLDDDIDAFSTQFAEIDALIERTGRVLRGEAVAARDKSSAVYQNDEEQEEAEDQWFSLLPELEGLPAVQAAAFGWQAWRELRLHDRQPWLGLIIAGAILRARGVTSWMLPLAAGFRQAGYRGRQEIRREMAVGAFCEILGNAVQLGNSDLSTLMLHRDRMTLRLENRRKKSKLGGLVELFLSRPVVTMPMAGMHLKVTRHAVKCMFDELEGSLPRELTQRSRYRAWGIL